MCDACGRRSDVITRRVDTVQVLGSAMEIFLFEPEQPAPRSGVIVVRHCWGGRVAWLGACMLPALRACAIFYGGRIKLAMGDQPPPIELASRIRCPVMGFFGEEDQNPTPADVDDYEKTPSNAGVEYTFHRYTGAGHAFQNFRRPNAIAKGRVKTHGLS
jgi:carboxymethylenebutenolidase